jgi:monofunctional biosynthetic peptidoglycan transglycosylase
MFLFRLWKYNIFRWFSKGIGFFFALSIISVVFLRVVPVWVTPLMLIRWWSDDLPIKYDWIPREKMSIHIQKAVIAGEDQRFLEHHGFDFDAIKSAIESNKHSKVKRGGSTISQQTAKNVFLFPQRNWLRKALETYFTVLIELLWSKERIMEMYLNVIEMGPGIYGIESASQCYFKKPASKLTAYESARIVAILPAPLKWSVLKPNIIVIQRQNAIFYWSHYLPTQYFEALLPKKEKK